MHVGPSTGALLVTHDGGGLQGSGAELLQVLCIQGSGPEGPLCPIRAYAPLELVHVDFTSVESPTELNKLPSVKMS